MPNGNWAAFMGKWAQSFQHIPPKSYHSGVLYGFEIPLKMGPYLAQEWPKANNKLMIKD